MSKTFIAIPCMDQVPAQFCHSLATLTRVDDTVVACQVGSLVYTSRNHLVRQALIMGADFILWLDSDMVFSADLLQRLMTHMEDPEIDFVSALYFRRVAPYSPVIYDELEVEDGNVRYTETKTIPDHPFEVAGCGFGGVLMRTSVAAEVANNNRGRMFDPIDGLGEDLTFCWRARQLGHRIICDPSITMGHVGHMVITKEFADLYRGG
jgi:GT2 family glycosyltransferase